jgi:glycosyltransferase involved in cell wall biosynthesis
VGGALHNLHMLPQPPLTPLHLVGRFDNPHTGAERELLALAQLMRPVRPVFLWSDTPVHPQLAREGVRQIQLFAQAFPRGGTLVVGGVHVDISSWLPHAKPQRVVLKYNLPDHARLFQRMETIRSATGQAPELRFVSHSLQASVGLQGAVEHNLIDIGPYERLSRPRADGAPFTVGRLSRDVAEKHHPQDVAVYRYLASHGHRVRLMGATCLSAHLGGIPGIEILPTGAMDAAEFLGSIDCFFYRTGLIPGGNGLLMYEAYGRVVFEAMASGLPAVLGAAGGYADFVADGEDCFLVHSQEQAIDRLIELATRPELAASLGTQARATASRLHGPANRSEHWDDYVR